MLSDARGSLRSFFPLSVESAAVRIKRTTALCLALAGGAVQAADPVWVDGRAAVTVQSFQQALLPGVPGTTGQVETALPVTATAFLRFGAVDLPNAPDSVSGEVSAWGRLGPRDNLMADGDVTAAWAQYRRGLFRVKLGRQVTLPGSSRYVRFDGASGGVSLGPVDLDVYAGWVALPRWNLPRGAYVLGFVGDALKDTRLLEAQARVGQITVGARAGVRIADKARAALAFHEQHDLAGVAFRVASADLSVQPLSWLQVGGRASLDLRAMAISEARVWADVTSWKTGSAALDYSYQSPSLLLPQTSVLAAFGGAAWHELGLEGTLRLPYNVTLTGRGAGQRFEGDLLGGRGTVRLRWSPGLDGRWLLQGELSRVLVAPSGYTQARLSGRWRATDTLAATVDGALFFYDTPVRGVSVTGAGLASLEWSARPWLRVLISGTALNSPWANFEVQGLGRVVVELDPVSTGGLP